MAKDKEPFIHMFETYGGKYLYDVNRNSIVGVSEEVYAALKNNEMEHKGVKALLENGFLSDNRVSTIVHPEDQTLEFHINNKISMLTLQITQACNLRCTYCPYCGEYNNRPYSNKKMSLEMAKKGIDFLCEHSIDSEQVNLAFYGGEPTLEFQLVKECIEYAKIKFEGKPLKFSITTNGTILTDEIIEYFCSNEVVIMISIDGPKEIHDKNRVFADKSGSFEVVMDNIKRIRNKYPAYFSKILFNVVSDPENDYSCTNQFILGNEVMKDAIINSSEINQFYRKEDINVSEDYMIKKGYEQFKLFLSKFNCFNEKKVSPLVTARYEFLKKIYNEQLKILQSLPERYHHAGQCIPGTQRLFMNADGTFYPCERSSESSEAVKIGSIQTGIDLEKVRTLLNIGRLTEKKCKNCWAIRYCSLCLIACDNLSELSAEKKLHYCKNVLANTEDNFKDICVLKELGMNFS